MMPSQVCLEAPVAAARNRNATINAVRRLIASPNKELVETIGHPVPFPVGEDRRKAN